MRVRRLTSQSGAPPFQLRSVLRTTSPFLLPVLHSTPASPFGGSETGVGPQAKIDRLANRPARLPHDQRLHSRHIRQTRSELDPASQRSHDCPGSDWHRPKLGCLSLFELDSSVQVYARQSEVISRWLPMG